MKKRMVIRTLDFQDATILGGQVSGEEGSAPGIELEQQTNALKGQTSTTDMGFHISADPCG